MSSLTVYHQSSPSVPNKLLGHPEDIAATLAEISVRFSRLPLDARIEPGSAQEEVLTACGGQLESLRAEHGCTHVEVFSQLSQQPQYAVSDAPLPSEWSSVAEELHWIVAGRGQFGLRVGEYVYTLQGEKNDLLILPAGIHYWLDGGEFPRLSAIRLFSTAANPANAEVASRFPRLED